MTSVNALVQLHLEGTLNYAKLLELKQLGREKPLFTFEGKRQCRLSEQYTKISWLTACPTRKSLFCFPCLLFKFRSSSWSSLQGMQDLGNFTNNVVKHIKSSAHIGAETSLKLLGKVRIDEMIDEGARTSRIMLNQAVRKNREMLSKYCYSLTQGARNRGAGGACAPTNFKGAQKT